MAEQKKFSITETEEGMRFECNGFKPHELVGLLQIHAANFVKSECDRIAHAQIFQEIEKEFGAAQKPQATSPAKRGPKKAAAKKATKKATKKVTKKVTKNSAKKAVANNAKSNTKK